MENQVKSPSFLGNPLVALVFAIAFGTAVGLLMGVDFPEAAYDDGPDAGVPDAATEYTVEAPTHLDLEDLLRRTDPNFRGVIPSDYPCEHHPRIW